MKRADNIHSYEQQWQDAFAEAEMAPNEKVWDGIELGLAKAANNNYKKRILFFKLLAAASISLAAVIGATYIINQWPENLENNQNNISEVEPKTTESSAKSNEIATIEKDHEHADRNQQRVEDSELGIHSPIDKGSKKDETEQANVSSKDEVSSESLAKIPVLEESILKANEHVIEDGIKSPNYLSGKGYIAQLSGELLNREMSFVPRLEYMNSTRKNSNNSWVGVSLAMGNNNPSASSQTSSAALSADNFSNISDAQNARVSDEQGGGVYTAGLALGMQMSKRWTLESGLNYMQRNTFVESNLTFSNLGQAGRVFSASEVSESSDVTITQDYEIRNTYSSIAVPIQAGYLVVDGKFDLLIKAGVSNKIFLWNRVEDTSNQLQTVRVKPGDDSQYNTYIFSGIAGAEVRYLLGDRYYISITPQAQKSINSITNSDVGEDSRPLIFLMGFRFKYLLK